MQLNDQTYYSREANEIWWSVSQFKDFMKCEAAAMAKLRGEYEPQITRAMLVGSFFDCYFEKTLNRFMDDHPEIYTRKGEFRSEFKKAQQIIDRVKSDPKFMQFMSGKKQVIMTAEMFGVPWKIKIDSFSPGICITDLKTAANFKSVPNFRYDWQGAIYQKVVELNGYGVLPFYLDIATKERVPDFDIFQIRQPRLDMALREIEENMPHFIEVKSGLVEPIACGKCDYCKSIKQARIRDYEELLEG